MISKEVKMSNQTTPFQIQINKTDHLILEYVKLPIISLSYRFLYRYTQPFEMVWVEGNVQPFTRECKILESDTFEYKAIEWSQHNKLSDVIDKWAMDNWKALIKSNCEMYGGETDPSDSVSFDGFSLPEEVRWILQMKTVECIECEIVKKIIK